MSCTVFSTSEVSVSSSSCYATECSATSGQARGKHLSLHGSQNRQRLLQRTTPVIGRYYTMGRDKRWERIEITVDGLVKGEGRRRRDGQYFESQ